MCWSWNCKRNISPSNQASAVELCSSSSILAQKSFPVLERSPEALCWSMLDPSQFALALHWLSEGITPSTPCICWNYPFSLAVVAISLLTRQTMHKPSLTWIFFFTQPRPFTSLTRRVTQIWWIMIPTVGRRGFSSGTTQLKPVTEVPQDAECCWQPRLWLPTLSSGLAVSDSCRITTREAAWQISLAASN